MTYYGIIAESGKVTDNTFKIYIPALMPKLKNNGATSETIKIDTDRVINKKIINSNKVSVNNFIIAESAHYFNTSFKGVNVFEMDKIDLATEIETTNTGEASNVATDPEQEDVYSPQTLMMAPPSNGGGPVIIPPHVHRALQPMMLYNMNMRNVNNKTVESGDSCLVLRVGDSFYVTYIFNKIEQNAEEDHDD